MENNIYWIWFSRIRKIGTIRKQRLLEEFKHPKYIWDLTKSDLLKVNQIGDILSEEILRKEYRQGLDNELKYLNKNNIKHITIQDEEYPEKLRHIYDSPISIYCKGNISLLKEFSLAIIGCRENTEYGKVVTNYIGYNLGKEKLVTVSGLAKGIDSIAHKATLMGKGKTIAVIGSGLDNIYPKENIKLAEEIVKAGGLIISEYPIGTKPLNMNFPARNRIISGLSDGVIVIEAKKKSGTMITVDFALEQGKNVFVIPGNLTSKNSEGTNELIKQGAKCVTCMEDIYEEYKMN